MQKTLRTMSLLAMFLIAGAILVTKAGVDDNRSTIGTSATDLGPGQWVDSHGYVRLPLEELQRYAAIQTPEEVQAVIDSGVPANLLFDSLEGRITAAVPAARR